MMKISKHKLRKMIRESYEEILKPKFYDDAESALMRPGRDKNFDATRPTLSQLANLGRAQEKLKTFKDSDDERDRQFARSIEQGLLPNTPIYHGKSIYELIMDALDDPDHPVGIIDDVSKQEFAQAVAQTNAQSNQSTTVSDLFNKSLSNIPRRLGRLVYPDPSQLYDFQGYRIQELPDAFLLKTNFDTHAIMLVFGGSHYSGNNLYISIRYYDGSGAQEIDIEIKGEDVAKHGSASTYFEEKGILNDLIYSWLDNSE